MVFFSEQLKEKYRNHVEYTGLKQKKSSNKKERKRSSSRRRVPRRRKQSSTSQEDSELSEDHSDSDLEEKNSSDSSDTASCSSVSLTEQGLEEEEELSDCGEHIGLNKKNSNSTTVGHNGQLGKDALSDKSVLQNGLEGIRKSVSTSSLDVPYSTAVTHLPNGDMQDRTDDKYSVPEITSKSPVEQELTLSSTEIIKILNQEDLPGIKVVTDWLILNSDIIVTFGEVQKEERNRCVPMEKLHLMNLLE
ncbi:uncharacterized protein LOC111084046 [Limulus polyphemus]|uniref:Uncharacterized protein LOC111084046 n=1 Tax=Limulus polyphemus TaxID=6850 RepID=A0ABM1RYS8_LIMPO|nr:uncharacterized protein LOC111084046 [Limulus polyphemus]